MTTIAVREFEFLPRLMSMAAEFVAPLSDGYPSGGDYVFEYHPDLTPTQAARFASLVRYCHNDLGLSWSEYEALEPVIGELRTLRTRTAAEWQAMTAAQRDTALIAWCQNITDVLRAILRD